MKGLSENIRVLSTIGRFLEHSRIFYFGRGESDPLNGKFFIGSSDWMFRNLNNRIETVVPIEEIVLKTQIWHIMQVMLNDRQQTWELNSEGNYSLPKFEKGDHRDVHGTLIKYYSERRSEN